MYHFLLLAQGKGNFVFTLFDELEKHKKIFLKRRLSSGRKSKFSKEELPHTFIIILGKGILIKKIPLVVNIKLSLLQKMLIVMQVFFFCTF